eukprot:7061569-Pyramimonas_sp.AAC.1
MSMVFTDIEGYCVGMPRRGVAARHSPLTPQEAALPPVPPFPSLLRWRCAPACGLSPYSPRPGAVLARSVST